MGRVCAPSPSAQRRGLDSEVGRGPCNYESRESAKISSLRPFICILAITLGTFEIQVQVRRVWGVRACRVREIRFWQFRVEGFGEGFGTKG